MKDSNGKEVNIGDVVCVRFVVEAVDKTQWLTCRAALASGKPDDRQVGLCLFLSDTVTLVENVIDFVSLSDSLRKERDELKKQLDGTVQVGITRAMYDVLKESLNTKGKHLSLCLDWLADLYARQASPQDERIHDLLLKCGRSVTRRDITTLGGLRQQADLREQVAESDSLLDKLQASGDLSTSVVDEVVTHLVKRGHKVSCRLIPNATDEVGATEDDDILGSHIADDEAVSIMKWLVETDQVASQCVREMRTCYTMPDSVRVRGDAVKLLRNAYTRQGVKGSAVRNVEVWLNRHNLRMRRA